MKKAIIICLLYLSVIPAWGENALQKADFRLFDGGWNIDSGPLEGFGLYLGKNDAVRSQFALLAPGVNGPVRTGKIKKNKRGIISGVFAEGAVGGQVDPASDRGLTAKGKFRLFLKENSLYELSGSFSGTDGAVFPVTAKAAELTFKYAKFVLDIAPTKRRKYKPGDSIRYLVTAELRGPAGVTPAQPELQLAFDNSVVQISVSPIKNISSCTVDYARVPNQVGCTFALLGTKAADAKLEVTAVVPEALAGKIMAAAVTVDDVAGYEPGNEFYPIFPSAAPRVSRIRINKSSNICPTVPGLWNTNSGTVNFESGGTYRYNYSGLEGTGLWKCEIQNGQLYLLIGLETSTGPSFPERYALTQNGTHFEGYNYFGSFVSGNKA